MRSMSYLKAWFSYRCICRVCRAKKIHRTDRIHSIGYKKLYLSFLLYWAFVREVSIKFYLSYEFFSYDGHDRYDRYNDMETRLKVLCHLFATKSRSCDPVLSFPFVPFRSSLLQLMTSFSFLHLDRNIATVCLCSLILKFLCDSFGRRYLNLTNCTFVLFLMLMLYEISK